MKLEFKKGFLSQEIIGDLGLDRYLELFNREIPILGHQIVRPLSEQDLLKKLQRLQSLKSQIEVHQIDEAQLLQLSSNLPNLSTVLPFFESQSLKPYHLFELGRFISEDQELQQIEESIPFSESASICQQIDHILKAYTVNQYEALSLSNEEKTLQSELDSLNRKFEEKLKSVESEIYKQTGLKMIYPFPKEVGLDFKNLDEANACSYLTVSKEKDFFRLDFSLEAMAEEISAAKEKLESEWKQLMEKKLEQLNRDLHETYDGFLSYYLERIERTTDYLILAVMKEQQLCLPSISRKKEFNLCNGILPDLRDTAEKYVPLNLKLSKGVNVLFGANMTGKTTVLKTVFFHLVCFKVGLPVPAESLESYVPREFDLHLRSSGNLQKGLSGFGEEIQFFSQAETDSSFYLIDELFHTTDPVSGAELSQIFLESYADCESILLVSSHYPEVLNCSDATFFRMKDLEDIDKADDIMDVLKNVPFEIEQVSSKQLKAKLSDHLQPLKIALKFQLPESIKQQIRKRLDN